MRPRTAAALAALLLAGPATAAPEAGLVIRGARLVDGSGTAARPGSLRVVGDRIAAVGAVDPAPGDTVVDAGGAVLAAGFVDAHSHADRDILERLEALAAVSQGITTVVVGQDGGSRHPLGDFLGALEETPVAVNVASFAGFGTLRREVLGDDTARAATPGEIAAMRSLLRMDLEAGALGLSTGLEYDDQIDAPTAEVIALAREAATVGGRYISHLRSEDRGFWEALEELIRIGRETGMPVQGTHLKLAMQSHHGQARRLLERLEAARAAGVRVTADVYPWTFWRDPIELRVGPIRRWWWAASEFEIDMRLHGLGELDTWQTHVAVYDNGRWTLTQVFPTVSDCAF